MKKLLGIILAFSIYEASAQISKVSVVDIENTVPIMSPSVAINPKNSANVVITTAFNKVYITTDSGATWRGSLIPPDFGVIGNSNLSVDKKGKFVLVGNIDETGMDWADSEISGPIGAFISDDRGKNWKKGGILPGSDVFESFGSKATVSLTSGNVYASWFQYGADGLEENIPTINFSSSPSGDKWSDPRSIIHTPMKSVPAEFPYHSVNPVMGPSGQVYITWTHDDAIYMDRTYDKGKMWLRNDIRIADVFSNGSPPIPLWGDHVGNVTTSVDISRSVYAGNIYITWADQRSGSGDSDVWLIKSGNRGDSWTNIVQKVHDGGVGTNQFNPIVKVDPANGVVYVLYMGVNLQNKYDLYLAFSIDGASNFTTVKVNDQSFDPIMDRKVHDFAVVNGVICPIWLQSNDGEISLRASVITYLQLGIK